MSDRLREFVAYRTRMNEAILSAENLQLKRFFNLDAQAFQDGALPAKTKELLGLLASMVLRCDDCITYHLMQCAKVGVTDSELYEAFNIALVVGGSIVIPHLRRAVDALQQIRAEAKRE